MQRTTVHCEMCGRDFESKDALDRHQLESHPQSRTVEGVGNAGRSGFPGARDDPKGSRIDLDARSEFSCSICVTDFESQEQLDTHLKTHKFA